MDNEYEIYVARDGSYLIYLGSTEYYENMLMFLSIFEPDIFQLEDGILRSAIQAKFFIAFVRKLNRISWNFIVKELLK
jgi:hypothetical protein